MKTNYYELLGVAPTADIQTLKKAFHRLSKVLHPDLTVLPLDEAQARFRQLCEAYELLSDPISRKTYDKTLENEESNFDVSNYKEFSSAEHLTYRIVANIDHRRPLSGGELLSLLLLCATLLFSLLLGIGVALLHGKELTVNPSWLSVCQSLLMNFLPPYI